MEEGLGLGSGLGLERKIMPIRETVAGEANLRSWVSKMKLTW